MQTDLNTQAVILIVDDTPVNIQMLQLILQKEDFKLLTASDGRKGLDLAREHQPDLILLDIMMPVMDGFEVCAQLKRDQRTIDIPVIFLTAKAEAQSITHGFAIGAVDYLTKPFNGSELIARVKTHITLRRSQRRLLDLERKNSVLAMVVTTNHELNQPLAVLNGNIFLLTESFREAGIILNEKQRNYLDKINASAKKMESILVKYRNAMSIRFENYAGNSKMVIFEDE